MYFTFLNPAQQIMSAQSDRSPAPRSVASHCGCSGCLDRARTGRVCDARTRVLPVDVPDQFAAVTAPEQEPEVA